LFRRGGRVVGAYGIRKRIVMITYCDMRQASADGLTSLMSQMARADIGLWVQQPSGDRGKTSF
jgi:hypothetical protein